MPYHQLFRQERENTCAVAAIRTVLGSQFGVQVSEAVLRFTADSAAKPIVKNGTDSAQMRKMVQAANTAMNTGPRWVLRTSRRGTFAALVRELNAGWMPMLEVIRKDGDWLVPHCVVALEHELEGIRYWDPETGRRCWKERSELYREWVDVSVKTRAVRWFGVITSTSFRPKADR